MQLFVSNELASGTKRGNCKDDVAILAPDKLVVQEGESIGNIIVRNMGTCRDDVRIFVQKLINGSEVPIDQKKFNLSGGESYTYTIPTLAAGKYKITVSAGGTTHVSEITVTPKPLVGGVSEFMSRAGVAVFANAKGLAPAHFVATNRWILFFRPRWRRFVSLRSSLHIWQCEARSRNLWLYGHLQRQATLAPIHGI